MRRIAYGVLGRTCFIRKRVTLNLIHGTSRSRLSSNCMRHSFRRGISGRWRCLSAGSRARHSVKEPSEWIKETGRRITPSSTSLRLSHMTGISLTLFAPIKSRLSNVPIRDQHSTEALNVKIEHAPLSSLACKTMNSLQSGCLLDG